MVADCRQDWHGLGKRCDKRIEVRPVPAGPSRKNEITDNNQRAQVADSGLEIIDEPPLCPTVILSAPNEAHETRGLLQITDNGYCFAIVIEFSWQLRTKRWLMRAG